MEQKRGKSLASESVKGMTEEERKAFEESEDFRINGNKYLEENGIDECMTLGATRFLKFLNMLQVFGDRISCINYSKPFRIVIDYDPEKARVVMHRYTTDKSGSESFREEME